MSFRSVSTTVTTPGDVTVVLAGEIDVTTQGELAAALAEALEQTHGALTVDMASVTFCDSSGLRQLVQLTGLCQEEKVDLRIQPSHIVRRVIKLTGLDMVLPLIDA